MHAPMFEALNPRNKPSVSSIWPSAHFSRVTHHPIHPMRGHRCFPALSTREETNTPIVSEQQAPWNQNLCADSVRRHENFALTQGPDPDTLCFEHRLFCNPVAEEPCRTLRLSQLHNRGVFGRSKVPLRKFCHLDVRTKSFEINSDILPL